LSWEYSTNRGAFLKDSDIRPRIDPKRALGLLGIQMAGGYARIRSTVVLNAHAVHSLLHFQMAVRLGMERSGDEARLGSSISIILEDQLLHKLLSSYNHELNAPLSWFD
jgi:hypothetical protein